MTQHKLKPLYVGMVVTFHPKVFDQNRAWYPYYEEYKGHTFKVVDIHPYMHADLVCLDDPSIIVKGRVHFDELIGSNHADNQEH